MAKTLVTGASGFIGSHLVKALEKRGDQVYKLKHENLRDETGLSILESMQDIDYIFHLASYGNMANQKDEFEILNANISCTWNLLQATKNIDYKSFIYVSSSSVLLDYQTMYSATKAAAESLCEAFIHEYNKPIAVVRPYSVYGPGEADHRLIPTIFRSCLTRQPMTLSEGTHDWVYVDDFVKFMIEVSKMNGMAEIGYVFECGTGVSTTNKNVVKLIEKITGKKANITKHKQLRAWDTNEWKAEENTSRTPLALGLQECYEYYKERYKE